MFPKSFLALLYTCIWNLVSATASSHPVTIPQKGPAPALQHAAGVAARGTPFKRKSGHVPALCKSLLRLPAPSRVKARVFAATCGSAVLRPLHSLRPSCADLLLTLTSQACSCLRTLACAIALDGVAFPQGETVRLIPHLLQVLPEMPPRWGLADHPTPGATYAVR